MIKPLLHPLQEYNKWCLVKNLSSYWIDFYVLDCAKPQSYVLRYSNSHAKNVSK